MVVFTPTSAETNTSSKLSSTSASTVLFPAMALLSFPKKLSFVFDSPSLRLSLFSLVNNLEKKLMGGILVSTALTPARVIGTIFFNRYSGAKQKILSVRGKNFLKIIKHYWTILPLKTHPLGRFERFLP
jgi:hypothetical protein